MKAVIQVIQRGVEGGGEMNDATTLKNAVNSHLIRVGKDPIAQN